MQKTFQVFLGFLFAATFAATVNLQGNLTDVEPTAFQRLAMWDRMSSTGWGYNAYYAENSTCTSIRDVCWKAFQERRTNATAWENMRECSSCSDWTDSTGYNSVMNYMASKYTREHTLFLQWLGATLSISAMALLFGAILQLLPLRALCIVILCMRLVILLTAFAIVSAFYTVKQSLFINHAFASEYKEGTKPGVAAVLAIVWILSIVLIICSLVWDPQLHSVPPQMVQRAASDKPVLPQHNTALPIEASRNT